LLYIKTLGNPIKDNSVILYPVVYLETDNSINNNIEISPETIRLTKDNLEASYQIRCLETAIPGNYFVVWSLQSKTVDNLTYSPPNFTYIQVR